MNKGTSYFVLILTVLLSVENVPPFPSIHLLHDECRHIFEVTCSCRGTSGCTNVNLSQSLAVGAISKFKRLVRGKPSRKEKSFPLPDSILIFVWNPNLRILTLSFTFLCKMPFVSFFIQKGSEDILEVLVFWQKQLSHCSQNHRIQPISIEGSDRPPSF